jgi:hypothetical protein
VLTEAAICGKRTTSAASRRTSSWVGSSLPAPACPRTSACSRARREEPDLSAAHVHARHAGRAVVCRGRRVTLEASSLPTSGVSRDEERPLEVTRVAVLLVPRRSAVQRRSFRALPGAGMPGRRRAKLHHPRPLRTARRFSCSLEKRPLGGVGEQTHVEPTAGRFDLL